MDNETTHQINAQTLNCACVLHGDKYDWRYVDNLYSMLRRHLSRDIKFHVFTEPNRTVPPHMNKQDLVEWPGVSGPKKSWWYKMQIFDPARMTGEILYMDLDVVIVDDIDWVPLLDNEYFWTIRDWRYLWRPYWRGMNSSMMFWDSGRFSYVWDEFQKRDINEIIAKFRGDQDFLGSILDERHLRFFPDDHVVSWRWQIKDGGLDHKTRSYRRPGEGSVLTPGAKVLVFHGSPKPHEIQDSLIQKSWM